jgi:hypothetical protein
LLTRNLGEPCFFMDGMFAGPVLFYFFDRIAVLGG